MTTARVHPRFLACRGQCAPAHRSPEHHDRLLSVDINLDVVLELMDIAVTWHELDYSETDVIGPADWLTFADQHSWRYPERAERAFNLAVDIVGRRHVADRTAGDSARLASVIALVR